MNRMSKIVVMSICLIISFEQVIEIELGGGFEMDNPFDTIREIENMISGGRFN
jgi:hypothetical protein